MHNLARSLLISALILIAFSLLLNACAGALPPAQAQSAGYTAAPAAIANDALATANAAQAQITAQAAAAQAAMFATNAAAEQDRIHASQTAQAAALDATRATAAYLDAQATTTQAANATAQWYEDEKKRIANESLEIEQQKVQLELDRQAAQQTAQAAIDARTLQDRVQAIQDEIRIETTYKRIKGYTWLFVVALFALILAYGAYKATDLGFWTVYHAQEERIARLQAGAQLAGLLSEGTTLTGAGGQKIPNPANSLKAQALAWVDESLADSAKPDTHLRPGQLTGRTGRESDELRKALAQAGLIYIRESVGTFSRFNDLVVLRKVILTLADDLSPTPQAKAT